MLAFEPRSLGTGSRSATNKLPWPHWHWGAKFWIPKYCIYRHSRLWQVIILNGNHTTFGLSVCLSVCLPWIFSPPLNTPTPEHPQTPGVPPLQKLQNESGKPGYHQRNMPYNPQDHSAHHAPATCHRYRDNIYQCNAELLRAGLNTQWCSAQELVEIYNRQQSRKNELSKCNIKCKCKNYSGSKWSL